MKILESINRTIKYSQKYHCQLTLDQLHHRLIGPNVFNKKEVEKFIKLSSYKVIKLKTNIIFEEKVKKVKELVLKISKKFPDILFIGISGSVAAEYPKENDDIDLFLITKKNCLWINRLKLRFYIYKNKIPHRKRGQKENKNEFCFNLWLDEDNLLIPENRQNLKNAMDLILLKPILNKNFSYEKLIKINDWAKKYVATGYAGKMSDVRSQMSDTRHKISDIRSQMSDTRPKISDLRSQMSDKIVNWLVFWPQYLFMKRKIKTEEIDLYRAFFTKNVKI